MQITKRRRNMTFARKRRPPCPRCHLSRRPSSRLQKLNFFPTNNSVAQLHNALYIFNRAHSHVRIEFLSQLTKIFTEQEARFLLLLLNNQNKYRHNVINMTGSEQAEANALLQNNYTKIANDPLILEDFINQIFSESVTDYTLFLEITLLILHLQTRQNGETPSQPSISANIMFFHLVQTLRAYKPFNGHLMLDQDSNALSAKDTLLVLTLAANHPAFAFDQRSVARGMIRRIRALCFGRQDERLRPTRPNVPMMNQWRWQYQLMTLHMHTTSEEAKSTLTRVDREATVVDENKQTNDLYLTSFKTSETDLVKHNERFMARKKGNKDDLAFLDKKTPKERTEFWFTVYQQFLDCKYLLLEMRNEFSIDSLFATPPHLGRTLNCYQDANSNTDDLQLVQHSSSPSILDDASRVFNVDGKDVSGRTSVADNMSRHSVDNLSMSSLSLVNASPAQESVINQSISSNMTDKHCHEPGDFTTLLDLKPYIDTNGRERQMPKVLKDLFSKVLKKTYMDIPKQNALLHEYITRYVALDPKEYSNFIVSGQWKLREFQKHLNMDFSIAVQVGNEFKPHLRKELKNTNDFEVIPVFFAQPKAVPTQPPDDTRHRHRDKPRAATPPKNRKAEQIPTRLLDDDRPATSQQQDVRINRKQSYVRFSGVEFFNRNKENYQDERSPTQEEIYSVPNFQPDSVLQNFEYQEDGHSDTLNQNRKTSRGQMRQSKDAYYPQHMQQVHVQYDVKNGGGVAPRTTNQLDSHNSNVSSIKHTRSSYSQESIQSQRERPNAKYANYNGNSAASHFSPIQS